MSIAELTTRREFLGAGTAALVTARTSAAVTYGMAYRSLADTVRDTHEWWMSLSDERRNNPRAWPTAERDAAVLARLGAS